MTDPFEVFERLPTVTHTRALIHGPAMTDLFEFLFERHPTVTHTRSQIHGPAMTDLFEFLFERHPTVTHTRALIHGPAMTDLFEVLLEHLPTVTPTRLQIHGPAMTDLFEVLLEHLPAGPGPAPEAVQATPVAGPPQRRARQPRLGPAEGGLELEVAELRQLWFREGARKSERARGGRKTKQKYV